MTVKNNILKNYGAVLDKKYGKVGTPEHSAFIEKAENFFTAQLIRDTRREAHVTQAELAKRINVTKSYISRIENGIITPSVAVFYRIIDALGMRVEIVKPIL